MEQSCRLLLQYLLEAYVEQALDEEATNVHRSLAVIRASAKILSLVLCYFERSPVLSLLLSKNC